MHARPLMISNQHAIELALSDTDMHSISRHLVEIVSLADGIFKATASPFFRQMLDIFALCARLRRHCDRAPEVGRLWRLLRR
jgi:hypothetical protein